MGSFSRSAMYYELSSGGKRNWLSHRYGDWKSNINMLMGLFLLRAARTGSVVASLLVGGYLYLQVGFSLYGYIPHFVLPHCLFLERRWTSRMRNHSNDLLSTL